MPRRAFMLKRPRAATWPISTLRAGAAARVAWAATLLLAVAAFVPARAVLVVLDVEPSPNEIGAAWLPPVMAAFNQQVNPASVTLRTFSTRGHNAGPVTGAFSFSPSLRTVSFDPFEAPIDHFDAGELVEVTLGTGLRSMSGEFLSRPVSWHFRALAQGGTGAYTATQDLNVGWGAVAVEAGRLNDDERIDIVAVTVQGKVVVLLNTTPGGQRLQTYQSHVFWIGLGNSSVLLRDFSGDGLLDIAVAEQDENLITIGRNLGDGTAYQWASLPTCDHPQRIVSGDLNGDGFEDLIFPCQYSAEVSVQLGAGDGSFGEPAIYPVGEWPIDAVVRDLDLDGDLDIVVSNELSESIIILRNQNPLAVPEQMFTVLPVVPLESPVGVHVDDLDGDRLPDIAVATVDSARIAVYKMLSDCQLAPPRYYATGGNPLEKLRGLAPVDFDGDGDLDLGVTNSDAGTWVLMENDGAGAFTARAQRSTGDRPILPLSGDFDRDGTVDLAVPTRLAGKVRIFYNAPEPAETGEPAPEVSPMPAVTLAVHPNPFRDTAQLTLRGAPAGRVEIVDAAGRLVRGFAATGSAGEQRIVWDGRDEAGRSVPPGAYFVRAGAPVQGRAVIIRLR